MKQKQEFKKHYAHSPHNNKTVFQVEFVFNFKLQIFNLKW